MHTSVMVREPPVMKPFNIYSFFWLILRGFVYLINSLLEFCELEQEQQKSSTIGSPLCAYLFCAGQAAFLCVLKTK